ncbi:hypothetical protein NM688_g8356 [Phlebia brevispora]|uniref:Uncharacterized protein n=1 Tax=Phlebia brevispora TaxID=194682 RepID=A0ACC1RU03_9APHY|nr:hypothetical protein NM688_g8356 [Phlebia brevispora]
MARTPAFRTPSPAAMHPSHNMRATESVSETSEVHFEQWINYEELMKSPSIFTQPYLDIEEPCAVDLKSSPSANFDTLMLDASDLASMVQCVVAPNMGYAFQSDPVQSIATITSLDSWSTASPLRSPSNSSLEHLASQDISDGLPPWAHYGQEMSLFDSSASEESTPSPKTPVSVFSEDSPLSFWSAYDVERREQDEHIEEDKDEDESKCSDSDSGSE